MTVIPSSDSDSAFRPDMEGADLSPSLNLLLNWRVNRGSDMVLRFTLRQLEYLVAVGDYGSVTEAAERVNVSAPSVSAAISQLEREFGIKFSNAEIEGLQNVGDLVRAIEAKQGA